MSSCIRWTGYIAPNGYGQRSTGKGTTNYAHRMAWEAVHGPIPPGMQIDHLCHDPEVCSLGNKCPHRSCVNPDHLALVTKSENLRAGRRSFASASALLRERAAAITHCPAGHPYDDQNTYVTKTGARLCKRCHADREQAKREANRAAGLTARGKPRNTPRWKYGVSVETGP